MGEKKHHSNEIIVPLLDFILFFFSLHLLCVFLFLRQGSDEVRSAFLRRAKERLSASASAVVRRWVAGDLEENEEEALKEHLPGLHEQVLAARGITTPRGNEEKAIFVVIYLFMVSCLRPYFSGGLSVCSI